MTGARDDFETAVRGVGGVWPPLPSTWSYSSLSDAEECPRRWALTRATYPGIWDRAGYPPRPILPALVGDVVHRVLELVLRGLRRHGCESLSDEGAFELMKELGGYSKLIEHAIDERLGRLVDNPRVAGRLQGIGEALRAKIPDMRQRVQAVLARTTLKILPIAGIDDLNGAFVRTALAEGSHPEVELRVPELRFTGRVDLVTIDDASCAIIDYKSGLPNEHHAEQLAIYALLWSRDDEVNPRKLPVSELVLAYATHDVIQDPPSDAELGALAQQLLARLAAAEGDQQERPPPARPSPLTCGFCSVRHMCDDYWYGFTADGVSRLSTNATDLVDAELSVVGQNGPRSWQVELGRISAPALLRTTTEAPGFGVGDRLRLLGVVESRDDDSNRVVLTMNQSTEAFALK